MQSLDQCVEGLRENQEAVGLVASTDQLLAESELIFLSFNFNYWSLF